MIRHTFDTMCASDSTFIVQIIQILGRREKKIGKSIQETADTSRKSKESPKTPNKRSNGK